MIELGEREATEAVAEKEAAETAAHAALMKEANLEVPYLLVCLICCIMCVCVCAVHCNTPHLEHNKIVMAQGRLLAMLWW